MIPSSSFTQLEPFTYCLSLTICFPIFKNCFSFQLLSCANHTALLAARFAGVPPYLPSACTYWSYISSCQPHSSLHRSTIKALCCSTTFLTSSFHHQGSLLFHHLPHFIVPPSRHSVVPPPSSLHRSTIKALCCSTTFLTSSFHHQGTLLFHHLPHFIVPPSRLSVVPPPSSLHRSTIKALCCSTTFLSIVETFVWKRY